MRMIKNVAHHPGGGPCLLAASGSATVRLSLNENPFGPSPKALEAVRSEAADTLRLYPDPQSTRLRDKYTYDLQQYGEDYAKFKYGSMFFAGLIGRPDASITPKVATVSLPHFGDVIRAEGEEVASTAAA